LLRAVNWIEFRAAWCCLSHAIGEVRTDKHIRQRPHVEHIAHRTTVHTIRRPSLLYQQINLHYVSTSHTLRPPYRHPHFTRFLARFLTIGARPVKKDRTSVKIVCVRAGVTGILIAVYHSWVITWLQDLSEDMHYAMSASGNYALPSLSWYHSIRYARQEISQCLIIYRPSFIVAAAFFVPDCQSTWFATVPDPPLFQTKDGIHHRSRISPGSFP
jgi:hypothetical protein